MESLQETSPALASLPHFVRTYMLPVIGFTSAIDRTMRCELARCVRPIVITLRLAVGHPAQIIGSRLLTNADTNR